jgi:hypothetical protein
MSVKEKVSKFLATSNFISAGSRDLERILFTVILIVICFYPDFAALRTAMFITGVFLVVALISHLTRKYALFPYLDMGKYARKALEENSVAAAIVFASVTGVIIVSISTAATFFAK